MMKARIDTLLEEVFFCIIEPSIEKREKSIRKKLEIEAYTIYTSILPLVCVYTSPGRWGAHYTTVHYPPRKKNCKLYTS